METEKKSLFKNSKNQLPSKKKMNLYVKVRDMNSLSRVIPAAVVLAVVVVLFCKFGVIDRLEKMDKVRTNYENSAEQLSVIEKELEDFNEVKEKYYRYTKHYMTEDELELLDRLVIIDMLEDSAADIADIKTFSIVDNTVMIGVEAAKLDDIAVLNSRLESSEYVTSVTVYNADKNGGDKANDMRISASFYIEVRIPEEASK